MADDARPPKPFKVGGVVIPRRVLYGFVVVALYLGAAAFAIGYNNAGSRSTSPTGTAVSTAVGTCWDGSGVDRGERCSTAYDAKALYWAFGIDPDAGACERSSSYSWSSFGLKCTFRGKDLRMAVWNSPKWRDKRLLEYGEPKSIGRGLLLHEPGSAGRYLIRYDSDRVLLYASVKDNDAKLMDKLRPQVKSLRELLYGVTTAGK